MTREEYLFVENLKGFRSYREIKRPDSFENQVFKWCHQESNVLIQSPNLQHFNIFGKIPEPLNQPYAKFTKFR